MCVYDFSKPLIWVDAPAVEMEDDEEPPCVHQHLMCGDEMVAWMVQYHAGGPLYGGSVSIQRTGATDMTLVEMRELLEKRVRELTGPDVEGSA